MCNTYHSKISNKLQIRCHSNDLKHATIPINISKDHKKNMLYILTIICKFYYITVSANSLDFVLFMIMFASNIL
jgi:hypothetical protein